MKSVSYEKQSVVSSKIVCIGRNYVEHIKELGNEVPTNMVLFMKPNSSIGDKLLYDEKDAIHFESEISFLVRDNKLLAVGLGLDLTKRGVQSSLKAKGLPWERAKAFRNSAVFSKFVSFEKVSDLRLELFINDMLVQSGGVDLMIYKPKEILEEILTFCDLFDNDIIMSGTPKGVGEIKRGDTFVGKIYENEKLLVEKKWPVC